MKRKFSLVSLSFLLALTSFGAAAGFIVKDKDGNYYECGYVTNANGESSLVCELLDHMPPIED